MIEKEIFDTSSIKSWYDYKSILFLDKQKQTNRMLMLKVCLIIMVLIKQMPSACVVSQDVVQQVPNSIYTTAKLLNETEEKIVLQIYSDLSQINDYNIGLQYQIYTNINPICNTNDKSIQTINSKNDIWLCFDQFYLLNCNQLWEIVIKCGTFIEIHRPFDSNILVSLNLQTVSWISDLNGLNVINMDLISLCAGTYHIWFVYYSRMGKFLKGVKTIYITYPNCNC